MLFPHGLDSIGLAPIEEWREILRQARKGYSLIGTNDALFPRHFGALARYHTEMRTIPSGYPVPGPLTLRQYEEFLQEAGNEYPVRFAEMTA